MALARLLTKKTDAEDAMPRVYDDPDFIAAQRLLTAFNERDARLEREKQRLNLEFHFRTRKKGDDAESDEPLRARLRALQAEPALLPPSSTATNEALVDRAAASPAIARGIEILAGATVAPLPGHAEQLAELDRQQRALGAAINEQQAIVDEIAGELSYKFAQQLQPEWAKLQLEFYHAAQRLARLTGQVKDFRRATLVAGIRPQTALLLTPNVRAPLILGDEADQNSEIRHWGRVLERLGIL